MKNGFTLVELSIVLVIIGLLIGGILVGQSLIDSAKLQSFVRQMQQYDAALLTFYTKYKSIPGDSRRGNIAVRGDGVATKDGILTDDDLYNNSVQNLTASATESMLYFYELVTMVNVKVENCPTLGASDRSAVVSLMTVSGSTCNLPSPKYGSTKTTAIFPAAFTNVATNIGVTNSIGNAYYLLDCTGTNLACTPATT